MRTWEKQAEGVHIKCCVKEREDALFIFMWIDGVMGLTLS